MPTNTTSFQQNITNRISSNLTDKNQTNPITSTSDQNRLDDIATEEEVLINPTLFDEPEDESQSLLNLGLQNYKSGKFIDAKFYFEKAAQKNNPVAVRHLGILYFLGQGVTINYKEANKFLKKPQVWETWIQEDISESSNNSKNKLFCPCGISKI